MENMTYRQLLKWLQGLNEDQLDSNVSVYVPYVDEYYPVESVGFVEEDDVLDKGHPLITTV